MVPGGVGVVAGHQPVAVRDNYNSLAYFLIEKKVGQGQFSIVFRARNTRDGENVALKKIQVLLYCVLLYLQCVELRVFKYHNINN